MLWNNRLSTFIRYIDELTIIIFIPFVLIDFYRNRKFPNPLYLILTIPFIIFGVSGTISGVLNDNSIFITLLGTFDYIKNFLVIFIYASLFKEKEDLNKVFNILLTITVLLGIVAFIQELWAVISHYIIGKDICDKSNYILGRLPPGSKCWKFDACWRLGIYRTPSLTNHPNTLGLYTLLILTIYIFINKKVNPLIFLSLFINIFFSVSRMVYTGFILLTGLQILKRRKWLIIPAVPVAVSLLLMSTIPDLNLLIFLKKGISGEEIKIEEIRKEKVRKEKIKKKFFRVYARDKAKEVWQDHFLWGVGPGMFGGVISIIFQSPVYKRYNFSKKWSKFIKLIRGIDQFWPQVVAEMGLAGIIAFAGLFISLVIMFYILRQRTTTYELRKLFTGLIIATAFIIIYTFGSGLNLTSFLFTYSALAGIGLGLESSTCK
jgi:hypothetical protein